MIISRTPLRIGLVGGGSDLPAYLEDVPQGGSVLGLTVDLYVYTSILALSPVAPEQVRLTYRKTESVDAVSEIEHPVVRAVLENRREFRPINIATMSDVPGGTGLGSSSSFTVGLIAALDEFEGVASFPADLATRAIAIEREILGEAGGLQDQYHAAFGGFRRYDFHREGVRVYPPVGEGVLEALKGWMLLVATKHSRASKSHQDELVGRIREKNTGKKATVKALEEMALLSRHTYDELCKDCTTSFAPFLIAEALSESWKLKKDSGVELAGCDEIIERGKEAGALAGKLCGAGGGGFVFLLVDPCRRERVVEALADHICLAINPECSGVRVLKV